MSMNAIMCTHWMDCKYANSNIHIKLFIYINMAPSFSRFLRSVRHPAHSFHWHGFGVFGQSLMQILQFKLKDGYCTVHTACTFVHLCVCCIRSGWLDMRSCVTQTYIYSITQYTTYTFTYLSMHTNPPTHSNSSTYTMDFQYGKQTEVHRIPFPL